MSLALTVASGLALVVWLYLFLFRGRFWLCDQRLPAPGTSPDPDPAAWPSVVAVVPARDEEGVIRTSLSTLLAQDYPGRFHVVLVDDASQDATRAIALELAGTDDRLTVASARPLPAGWSGKLWAVSEGLRQAAIQDPEACYVWLTDADIGHDPGNLRRLVAKAEAQRLDLVSLMVLLNHRGLWAGLLIPAFVFFFQKLYPFRWVNTPTRPDAAAAGGCILVRRDALEAVGGIARIRGALIDDCTLGAVIKAGVNGQPGRLWLGLSTRAVSLRPYSRFREIWDMVIRSAYTQLNHSPWLLAGAVLGMVLTYLTAPIVVLTWSFHQVDLAALFGIAAWFLMVVAYQPTLRLYRKPRMAAWLLPVVGFLYSLMTIASAVRHWRGRGGQWKGRVTQTNLDGAAETLAGRPIE